MVASLVRRAGLLMLLVISVSCGDPQMTTAPSATPAPPTSNLNEARTFQFASAPLAVSPSTVASRYVLYDDGRFMLAYPGGGFGGKYKKEDGSILLEFTDSNRAGLWRAVGVLEGSTLTVTYNVVMMLADFEDARYVQVQ
jgi:hypothetical protein